MVKLNKIYTRTGDDGTTGLVTGGRCRKDDLRIVACGDIDEANACIGVARLYTSEQADPLNHQLDEILGRVQNDLFDLGADLATPDIGQQFTYEPLRIIASQVEWIEQEIDRLNSHMKPLSSFILPGGSKASAYLHQARTVVRRAERNMVALAAVPDEQVSAPALHFINRLSDLLFVAARAANQNGHDDILWIPGGNR